MKRVTIRDVARLSGYSITTVSLVLNKKDVSIPDRTKEKIWQAADELNYRPNQIAISMLTKRSKVLGLIIPDNMNSFFAGLSRTVENEAKNRDYGLVFGNSDNEAKQDLNYMQMFFDRQVDGIIYAKSAAAPGSEEEKKIIDFIQKSNLPFVAVDRPFPGYIEDTVMTNHFKGGYLATRHLINLGHEKIGCFTGPKNLFITEERLEGYRSALLEAGLEYDENLIFEGTFHLGQEKKALEFFIKKKVSAIFSFNDMMAFGIYREAYGMGIKIPKDISIVGFDDIPETEIVQPPLTTIHQPAEKIGRQAVKTITEILDDKTKNTGKTHLFEPTLIVRGSTRSYKK